MSVKHTTQNIKSTKPFLFSVPTGEVESFCADLSGRLHINAAVRMSVDKLHDLLFSADTNFIQHLFSQRHFTGRENTHAHKYNSHNFVTACTHSGYENVQDFSLFLFLLEHCLRDPCVFLMSLHRLERFSPTNTELASTCCIRASEFFLLRQ